MAQMTFPTRVKDQAWTVMLRNPAFELAASKVIGLPYDHDVALCVAHAAFLIIECDSILESGGFND